MFHSFILREVLLAEGLKDDLERAGVAAWLGKLLAVPASIAVKTFIVGTAVSPLAGVAAKVTKAAIVAMCTKDRMFGSLREGRLLWQKLKLAVVSDTHPDAAAHSCCRTALCYALLDDRESAEEWLARADELADGLARPNFIRGLMFGSEGRVADAVAALLVALDGRA